MSKSPAGTHDDARAGFFGGKLAGEMPERRQFFWCKGIEKAHQRNPHLTPSSILGLDVAGACPALFFFPGQEGGLADLLHFPKARRAAACKAVKI
jgi:hypothetical protein